VTAVAVGMAMRDGKDGSGNNDRRESGESGKR
jgi:hypothetical protein